MTAQAEDQEGRHRPDPRRQGPRQAGPRHRRAAARAARSIVENLNIVKRHTRPRPMQRLEPHGRPQVEPGRHHREGPRRCPVSNVMLVCPVCNRPTRVGIEIRETKGEQHRRCASASAPTAARRSTGNGDATTATTRRYTPRLKELYESELRARLKDELGLRSIMQVPRIQKITLNMGVGEAKTDAKALDAAIEELTTIAGQRAQMRRARKSIAQLQAPRGDADRRARSRCAARACGSSSTGWSRSRCRASATSAASTRDSFDGRGNYSLGIREQIIFPEIDYDDVAAIRGPRRRHHDHRRDGRAGARAPARRSACRSPASEGEGSSSGKEVAGRQAGRGRSGSRSRKYIALQPLRPAARGVPEVRPLPDLPARARAPGRDPRHDEVELVGGRRC